MIRYNPNINEGLNTAQVQYRNKYGYINTINDIKMDSIFKIIVSNLINLFNLLNLYIAILFFIGNSYIGFIFVGIIILNTLMRIVKELRTRAIINKFNKNNDVFTNVVRDSNTVSINKSSVVLDDIIVYKTNSNIVTDSIIIEGSVLVDESCLSGKKPIIKNPDDMLYAGSKILGGKCICRAEKVGDKNYLSKIINVTKDKTDTSYIKNILNRIIKYVSVIVVILSIVFYINKNSTVDIAVYLYKIIPIELILFTTIIFLVSVIKLKSKNILVRNFKSMESIHNIDTICFDKTGTLTKNNLVIDKVVILNKKYDYINILSAIGKYCDKSSELIRTISKKYNKKTDLEFISENKEDNYTKINFKGHKYYLGDPSILDSSLNLDEYNCYKVELLKTDKDNIALILLTHEIKEDSKELISSLYNSNIDIKIISGDTKDSIINTCKKIGIKRIKSIDMSLNNTNMNHQIVEEYNVFYNVSAEQKKILINALKGNNHSVMMVGDGINDILSLDASTSSVSINNDFKDSMKVTDYAILDDKVIGILDIIKNSIISINNICKLMQLYLFKIIYSFLIVITFYILNINSFKFDLIYGLIFLIPSILIVFSKKKNIANIASILNNSILISLITYILTIVLLILNIDIKFILLLVSSMVFITLLKFNLLNKILSILLIIIAFSCIIIL